MPATHEVINQPPPLEGLNGYLADRALAEAVRREGAAWGDPELVEAGAFVWSAEARHWGRAAEANRPVLQTHDRHGNRIDRVEYHPAYHQLMAAAVARGLHGAAWSDSRPGAHVLRCAKTIVWSPVDYGHMCPLSMTYAVVAALRNAPELAMKWEPGLVSLDYDPSQGPASGKRGITAGMAMTEKQGGSDVRANTSVARPSGNGEYLMLGKIRDLPDFVKKNHIDVVYLSLPMASQSRILSLLDAMRDTTASVYFVPDLFVTDLIQGRIDSVRGLPIVGVCDTPFFGWNGLVKRAADIVLSLLILALIAPLLLVLAIVVKLSSPGPVIFRQRRYGLAGDEIVVYKFRTMNVMEDGEVIKQTTADDPRLTPLGAFMRRTSLDELPQFVNVLQGRMSIVGPRPHAVAHNEMYRKLINGYMLRHKVKPGITGWAQVNGLRGETRTVERMKARIDYDLDYLRNWSLRLDLFIIAKTVWVVLRGRHAN